MQLERFIVPAGQTFVLETGSLGYGEMLVGTFEVAGGRDVDFDFELLDPEGRIVVPGPYLLRFGNARSWIRLLEVALPLQGYAVGPFIGRQG